MEVSSQKLAIASNQELFNRQSSQNLYSRYMGTSSISQGATTRCVTLLQEHPIYCHRLLTYFKYLCHFVLTSLAF